MSTTIPTYFCDRLPSTTDDMYEGETRVCYDEKLNSEALEAAEVIRRKDPDLKGYAVMGHNDCNVMIGGGKIVAQVRLSYPDFGHAATLYIQPDHSDALGWHWHGSVTYCQ